MKRIILLAIFVSALVFETYAKDRIKNITAMYNAPSKETFLYANMSSGDVKVRRSSTKKWGPVSLKGMEDGERIRKFSVSDLGKEALTYAVTNKRNIYYRRNVENKWVKIHKNGLPKGNMLIQDVTTATTGNLIITYILYSNGEMYYRFNQDKKWTRVNGPKL